MNTFKRGDRVRLCGKIPYTSYVPPSFDGTVYAFDSRNVYVDFDGDSTGPYMVDSKDLVALNPAPGMSAWLPQSSIYALKSGVASRQAAIGEPKITIQDCTCPTLLHGHHEGCSYAKKVV